MVIADKSHGSASLNEVLREMINLNYVSTDTMYEIMYRLEIGDPEKLANQSTGGKSNIWDLLVSLRSKNIPVTAGMSVNVDFPLKRNVFEFGSIDNMDVTNMANYLAEKYGLELRKSDGELMQVIRITSGTKI